MTKGVSNIYVRIDGKEYIMDTEDYDRFFRENGYYPEVLDYFWKPFLPQYYPESHKPLVVTDEEGNPTGIRWGLGEGVQEAGDAIFGDTSDIAGKIDIVLSPGYIGTQEALEAVQDPWNWYKVIGIGAAAVAALGIGYIFTKTASEKIVEKVIK